MILGIMVAIPYAMGTTLGGMLFRPGYERVYRGVAYAIIAISAIRGLPIWGG